MTNSSWEDYFENQLNAAEIKGFEKEYRFLPTRRFRFDFCFPAIKFAIEVDGATYSGGRHTTGAGFARDCEKFALAAIEGYKVIRVTTGQVSQGKAIEWVKEYFNRQVNNK